ncbi:hypothetical protein [Hyphococcus sp.]|uniref:hypothetical protein n=1 Tax=Hyphococcus sp. TaxID=2038636 RepID=UPI003CCBA9E3
MPLVIVSSLASVDDVFKHHDPAFAISILDHDDALPAAISALPEGNQLRLGRSDGDAAENETRWPPAILALAKRWAATDSNILVHCHRGVARSMAIAYILMCMREHDACEQKIAHRLRAAAPHADPNLLLVSSADAALKRDDRMVSAVLDMCPSCPTISAPVVTLPVA